MHRGVPRMVPGVSDRRGRRAASDPPPITKPDDRLFRSSAEVRRECLPMSGVPAGGADSPVSRVVLTEDSVSRSFPFVATYQAGDGWNALGDPTRRAIIACLAERPRAVGELADELPLSRPPGSQHLRVVKDAVLVTDRAAGTRRVYPLNPAGV